MLVIGRHEIDVLKITTRMWICVDRLLEEDVEVRGPYQHTYEGMQPCAYDGTFIRKVGVT